jgi:coenzyme PQQ precursor peptide PqqA
VLSPAGQARLERWSTPIETAPKFTKRGHWETPILVEIRLGLEVNGYLRRSPNDHLQHRRIAVNGNNTMHAVARTLLKEAEQHVGSKYVDQVLDSLYVIETAMQHFFIRAEMRKHTNDKPDLIDADYVKAAHLAALVAPFRHARLSAMKLAGDPNSPLRIRDDASADEIRAEIMKRLRILVSAGLIDLKALPMPDGGIANQPVPGVDQSGINGE